MNNINTGFTFLLAAIILIYQRKYLLNANYRAFLLIYLFVLNYSRIPEDQGSILSQVMPKIKKMVLDASLLITQHYKVEDQG